MSILHMCVIEMIKKKLKTNRIWNNKKELELNPVEKEKNIAMKPSYISSHPHLNNNHTFTPYDKRYYSSCLS